MMNAKSKTLVAGALAAVVTLVAVGCGDGKNRPAPIRRSGLTNGANGKPGSATNGTPEGTAAAQGGGRTGKDTPSANGKGTANSLGGKGAAGAGANGKGTTLPAAKADPNEAEIQKQEDALKTGVPITKEQMAVGTYRLESTVTSVFVSNNIIFARAIQSNRVLEQGSSLQLQSASKLASGFLPTHTDDGHVLDLPFQFELTAENGKWTTAKVFPVAIRSFTTTETGKLEISDRLDSAASSASNVLNLITSGELKDRRYTGKGENQKLVEVNLYKVDDQTLRVLFTVEESLAAGVDTTGTQSVTFYRNFFLTYKVKAPAANADPGQTQQ